MNYSGLSEETQLFLNKAMDVYATIKDKKITRTIKESNGTINYDFTKLDKKVLSLFIAGFLVDGSLKQIFSQYDDIKLDDLFDFIGITESDITAIEAGKYEEFFNTNFKIDLINNTENRWGAYRINFITPEIIIGSFKFIHLHGSKILEYYKDAYKLNLGTYSYMYEHPIFSALDTYVVLDDSISNKYSPQGRENRLGSSSSPMPLGGPKPLIQPQQQSKVIKFDDSVWQLLDYVKPLVPGHVL